MSPVSPIHHAIETVRIDLKAIKQNLHNIYGIENNKLFFQIRKCNNIKCRKELENQSF